MSCQACEEQFRFEFCDLSTGIVRAIHTPTNASWETLLNGWGRGAISLATKDVRIRDIWPHLTSVYVLRTAGGIATTADPVVEFAGMIERVDANDTGITQLGIQEITRYLFHRLIRETLGFGIHGSTGKPESQTKIAKALVDYAAPDGIPLKAVAGATTRMRDRKYESWNRSVVGEMIENLSNVIDGIEWDLSHARNASGGWETTMNFRNTGQVGAARGIIFRGNVEAMGFGLDVDASDHATLVDAIGEGEEADMKIATAQDTSGIYPRFDSAPAWKDVSIQATLEEHADGYLEEHQEPFALPDVVLRGMDPSPDEVKLGDTVDVDVNYGAVTYVGQARITGISWNLSGDEPATRDIQMQATTRASSSVLNQVPTDDCPEC